MAVLELLRSLSDERFLSIYEALSDRGFGPLDAEVAKALKFRPQAIRKVPMGKRAKRAWALIDARSNTELCYELFGTYLVRTKNELVTDFLDATGVEHDEGMIEGGDDGVPAPDKIRGAFEALDEKFDRDDVTLYLALCVEQWPESEEIKALWAERGPKAVSS